MIFIRECTTTIGTEVYAATITRPGPFFGEVCEPPAFSGPSSAGSCLSTEGFTMFCLFFGALYLEENVDLFFSEVFDCLFQPNQPKMWSGAIEEPPS